MNVSERLNVLESLLARVQERAVVDRTLVARGVGDHGADAGAERTPLDTLVDEVDERPDLETEVMLDAGHTVGDGVQFEELEAAEELEPASRTENVSQLPAFEEDVPRSERRPRSELPVAEVKLEDLEREAEPPGFDIPTMEQMGNTVDLPGEGEENFALELEQPLSQRPASQRQLSEPPPFDDFEVSLPRADFAGGYDESLVAPPSAQADLAQMDAFGRGWSEPPTQQSSRPPTAPPPAMAAPVSEVQSFPDSPASVPPPFSGPPPSPAVPSLSAAVLAHEAAGGPQSMTRGPADVTRPVAAVVGSRPMADAPFCALLDASLALGER